MTELTIEIVLEHYKKKLGSKFRKYSYEAFLASRAVVKNYKKEKGEFEALAHVALNHFMYRSFAKLPTKKLFSFHESVDVVPNTDATHLKLDLIKRFGEENYNIFYLNVAEKLSVASLSKTYNLTVDAINYRLSRIHKYIDESYRE